MLMTSVSDRNLRSHLMFKLVDLLCSGGQWNSGGACDSETEPIKNETYLTPYSSHISKHHQINWLQKGRAPISVPETNFIGRREEDTVAVPRLQPLVPPRSSRLLERDPLLRAAPQTQSAWLNTTAPPTLVWSLNILYFSICLFKDDYTKCRVQKR